MKLRKVLVVVVLHNGMEWLDRCLGSVPSWADLYVVDNASADGSAERVAARFPQAVLVRSESNLGFGPANNLGMQHALAQGYDAVYLLNQDAWLLPGALEELVRVGSLMPEYGILSPVQLQADGKTQDVRFARRFRDARPPVGDAPVRELPFVMAAHWLVSRPCLEKVGGFAPIFVHNGEDDNYCDRARYHGFRIGVVPSARAVHDRSGRKGDREREMRLNCFAGNLARLCDINRPLGERWFFVTLFCFVKMFRYRSFRPWHYWRELVRMAPGIRHTRAETR